MRVAVPLLLVVAAGPVATTASATADCPCVDVSHLLPQTASGCIENSCDSPLQLDNSSQCVSTQYGSSTCGAWDQTLPTCQVTTSVPGHCAEQWCYVNHTLCRSGSVSYRATKYFPEVENLFYSYATCGGDYSTFRSFEMMQEASTRGAITVVLPSATYFPYHYKLNTTSDVPLTSAALAEHGHYRNDGVPWQGLLVQYLGALTGHETEGLGHPDFHLTWVSAASRALHSSAWTAAVNDVALGIADLGCSLFWMTAERLEMATFTANLFTDLFYLFVPKPHVDHSLMTQVYKPFKPFKPEVWLAVGVVIIVVGSLQTLLTKRLWWDDWAEKVGWEGAPRRKKAGLLLSRFVMAWYDTYMGVVTGGPELDEEHRLATRLLNVGLGLFILLFLSAYTANLAAYLTIGDLGDFWSDIGKAIDGHAKICAHVGAQGHLTRAYPRADFHFRYMDSASDLRAGLTEDGCHAFVMEIRAMSTDAAIDAVRCEKGFVMTGAAVAELDVALPAKPEVADLLTFWMKTLDENGTSYMDVASGFQAQPTCPMQADVTGVSGLEPLSLSNFAAPLLILALFMGLAITTRMARHSQTLARKATVGTATLARQATTRLMQFPISPGSSLRNSAATVATVAPAPQPEKPEEPEKPEKPEDKLEFDLAAGRQSRPAVSFSAPPTEGGAAAAPTAAAMGDVGNPQAALQAIEEILLAARLAAPRREAGKDD